MLGYVTGKRSERWWGGWQECNYGQACRHVAQKTGAGMSRGVAQEQSYGVGGRDAVGIAQTPAKQAGN